MAWLKNDMDDLGINGDSDARIDDDEDDADGDDGILQYWMLLLVVYM